MSIGIGEALRNAREDEGRTLEEAAQESGLPARHLETLEAEQFEAFGGDVYAKGWLSQYARYLGLDPEPLLEVYRREHEHEDDTPRRLAAGPVAGASRSAPPAWVAWVLVAAAALVGAIALGNAVGGRTPTPADDETAAVAPQPADSETPSPTSSPSPSPSPSPSFDGVELFLAFEEAVWTRIEVDGTVVEASRTWQPGETVTYQGDSTITVRFGNPGGVRVELNGESLGSPGPRGQPRTVTFTPEGIQDAQEA